MLAQVRIAEADSFVAMWNDLKLPDGRDRAAHVKPDRERVRDGAPADSLESLRACPRFSPNESRAAASGGAGVGVDG
jgi:hypothetical protein